MIQYGAAIFWKKHALMRFSHCIEHKMRSMLEVILAVGLCVWLKCSSSNNEGVNKTVNIWYIPFSNAFGLLSKYVYVYSGDVTAKNKAV